MLETENASAILPTFAVVSARSFVASSGSGFARSRAGQDALRGGGGKIEQSRQSSARESEGETKLTAITTKIRPKSARKLRYEIMVFDTLGRSPCADGGLAWFTVGVRAVQLERTQPHQSGFVNTFWRRDGPDAIPVAL